MPPIPPVNELFADPEEGYTLAMGRKTVHFNCHSCGHCCTEVVCLPTPDDVRRIIAKTGEIPSKFLEFLTPEELEASTMTTQPGWNAGVRST